MSLIAWSEIDTNSNSVGYLDSVEVAKAKKKGVSNVFVGMIQQDYEGNLNIDAIIDKYDKGAYGRIPYFPSMQQCTQIENMYRELVVLKCKHENLLKEFHDKFGLIDDFKNIIAKAGIIKKNTEYNNYKARLNDLNVKVMCKEQELQRLVDSSIYKERPQETHQESMNISVRYNPIAMY